MGGCCNNRYKFEIAINWVPTFTKEELFQSLQKFKVQFAKKALGTFCPFERIQENGITLAMERQPLMPKRLWVKLVSAAGGDCRICIILMYDTVDEMNMHIVQLLPRHSPGPPMWYSQGWIRR